MLPPFGSDGHSLLSRGSTDLWWPSAAAFLVSLDLPTSLEVELPPPNYGSVAYEDAGGRYGMSRNHDSQPHADEAALRECAAEKCKIVFHVGPHQCGAIALTEDGKIWGGAVRQKRDEAELAAVGNCQKRTGDRCKVRGADCNQ